MDSRKKYAECSDFRIVNVWRKIMKSWSANERSLGIIRKGTCGSRLLHMIWTKPFVELQPSSPNCTYTPSSLFADRFALNASNATKKHDKWNLTWDFFKSSSKTDVNWPGSVVPKAKCYQKTALPHRKKMKFLGVHSLAAGNKDRPLESFLAAPSAAAAAAAAALSAASDAAEGPALGLIAKVAPGQVGDWRLIFVDTEPTTHYVWRKCRNHVWIQLSTCCDIVKKLLFIIWWQEQYQRKGPKPTPCLKTLSSAPTGDQRSCWTMS